MTDELGDAYCALIEARELIRATGLAMTAAGLYEDYGLAFRGVQDAITRIEEMAHPRIEVGL